MSASQSIPLGSAFAADDPIFEPETPCDRCKHFFAGTADTRNHPGEQPECGHPKLYTLMTHNIRAHGMVKTCKGFSPRQHSASVIPDECAFDYFYDLTK